MGSPTLQWDYGTAYDMMISLVVLHNPTDYGLRAAWAAGMRSRLPGQEREFLETLSNAGYLHTPLGWLHGLPAPKDGATLLRWLGGLPAAERLPVICLSAETAHKPFMKCATAVMERGSWDKDDLAAVKQVLHDEFAQYHKPIPPKTLELLPTTLDWWAEPSEFGEKYLRAMQTYYEVFFAEEERRIAPALNQALEHARDLAETLPVADLLLELSQGVRSDDMLKVGELVLAPCYWSTPLIFYDKISPERMIMLFGARPAEDSLVPGEAVPEALLRTLKAISDPTRLRILRYLMQDSLTPSQLARRLRLRPPTVIHHLQALRAASLVQLTVDEGKERVYSTRPKALEDATVLLMHFLRSEGFDDPAVEP